MHLKAVGFFFEQGLSITELVEATQAAGLKDWAEVKSTKVMLLCAAAAVSGLAANMYMLHKVYSPGVACLD